MLNGIIEKSRGIVNRPAICLFTGLPNGSVGMYAEVQRKNTCQAQPVLC